MTDLRKLVVEKFTSGNGIKVECITITRAEYEAALAQPEQEPVAWMEIKEDSGFKEFSVWKEPISKNSIPLYTAPTKREWVGLTDEEIALFEIRPSCSGVARDIETKLKEKNK